MAGLLDTLNELFNTLSDSLDVHIDKGCAWSLLSPFLLPILKVVFWLLFFYCEQIAILNLFKINVFLYDMDQRCLVWLSLFCFFQITCYIPVCE